MTTNLKQKTDYTHPNKIYCERVQVTPELQEQLAVCCKNHLVLYNQVLEHFRQNKDMSYLQLREYAAQLLESTQLTPVIKEIVNNDIYHMHKKKDFKQKLLTGIQYMTIIVSDYYSNRNLEYIPVAKVLRFRALKGNITLPKLLPVVNRGESVYLNLGYSAGSGIFEISVFRM